MQGGSASGISMTAYVLISLLENKNNSDVSACYSNLLLFYYLATITNLNEV